MNHDDLNELTELFRRLGASEPESWAGSQVREQIPQLHRYLFLRQAWKRVLADGETDWIDAYIRQSESNPDEPFAGTGVALKACIEAGASREDIAELVRGMQAELLFGFCYLLGDPGIDDPEARDINWALVSLDEEGQPMEFIGGLHESVLETDPTGREMRPNKPRDTR